MAGATAYLPAALTVASSLMGASGASDAAGGARLAGQRTATAKRFEAVQLRQNAGQEVAAAQRQGMEEQRQARLVQSRQLALAAASGAGASDSTVVQMIARTEKEGSYRAAVALYGGAERARAMRMAAAGREYEAEGAIEAGESQAGAYESQGLSMLLKGGSSLFSKYGFGGPKGDSATTTSGGLDTSWLDSGPISSGTFGIGAGA